MAGTHARRRRPLPLRILRRVAALVLVSLAGLVGYESLRAFGFRFRWEVELPQGQAGARVLREVPVAVSTLGAPERRSGAEGAPPLGGATTRVTVLAPPPADDTVSAAGGVPATIDFESFPDGTPACTNCPIGDEWASVGVRFSFRSWTSTSTEAFVIDAGNFLPDGASPQALGPALRGTRGLEVGVLRLDFSGRPRQVAFTLSGPDLISTFEVVAWSGRAILGPRGTRRSLLRRYRPAGRGLFRSERIVVEAAGGIDRVSLDGWGPPGHVLLVNDLTIDP